MGDKYIDVLIIMDGYGLAPDGAGNCIGANGSEYVAYLREQYPNCVLEASGTAVGLPEGQMGNSEVGHLNIGAGRVVFQELTAISNAIKNGEFFDNEELIGACEYCKQRGSKLHLFGLLGDGGVHSHIDHLKAMLELCKKQGVQAYLHCFTDGRDVSPHSGAGFVREIKDFMKQLDCGEIATVCGRYYAMDRDNRWDRIEKAYRMLTFGEGKMCEDPVAAVNLSYNEGVTDEFVKPIVVVKDGSPVATVSDGDGIVFFNFRPDRARQLTRVFMQPDFKQFDVSERPKDLKYVTFTEYDKTFNSFEKLSVAFKPRKLVNTLGECLANNEYTQVRIAETEKYAHVTFFFNGGEEEPNLNETRVLIDSPKVATYDLKPEMSAVEVTNKAIDLIKSGMYDVMILNFANCDMVGHTGNIAATKRAVYVVDLCVKKLTDVILNCGGRLFLTADHGNAEKMLDKDGPFTAHTTNKVPFIVVDTSLKRKLKLKNGRLCDIAPTMLALMELDKPEEMTGSSLAYFDVD
ncbi:MAG: 2,3-bisphosphoglycerate-independent phosphoglycerate mutase [Clostridia bacterium]|nr:2,3-bisphosphoglycerate-independent phosphoglycerate mutase [Clostridia bacterium]